VTDRSGQTKQIGGKPFSYDLIRSMIENPLYKGCVRCGEELFEGKHEALIPVELWELANARLRQNGKARRPRSRNSDTHIHLFKGLLRCGECGAAITPYPSGKEKPDGSGPYLYYTCLSARKARPNCSCNTGYLPARAFEQALIDKLGELAEDTALLEHHLVEGLAAERRDVSRLRNHLERLQSEMEDVDEKLDRLIAVFEESEDVPKKLKLRCSELDERRAELRLEMIQTQDELDELAGASPSAPKVASFLQTLTAQLRTASLPEKKSLIGASIGRIDYNLMGPADGLDGAPDGVRPGVIRTRDILVITRLKCRPAESGDSAGHSAKSHNQNDAGSGIGFFGSAPASPSRTLATLRFPLYVPIGRRRSRPAERRDVTEPRETPEERRERFQRLMDSGRYASQQQLADELGCSQAWVSKVLRGKE
jgi:hypothetical protein